MDVNPFCAFAVTEIDFAVSPAIRLRLVGATVSEKSGAGAAAVTVSAMGAVWVRLPDVPVKVMDAMPAVEEDAAVSVRFCAVPGTSVSVDGLAVTPEGKPLSVTVTVPVKPFRALAVTEADCPAPPAVNARFEGVADREKSAFPGCPDETELEAFVPQPEVKKIVAKVTNSSAEVWTVLCCIRLLINNTAASSYRGIRRPGSFNREEIERPGVLPQM